MGFLASLGAGLATGIGALPVMLPFGLSEKAQGILLGVGGGVMLAATSFSLLNFLVVSTLTGLVEPIGGLLGASLVSFSEALLPWGMAFAAGAMLFVIVDEIIPDIDQKAIGQVGTVGVMIGFVLMMFLDVTLG
jgi:ZIP family zinc transporter